ncbi:DUF2207 domain-containing protein [Candidatus Uhrbacteria bacterium]|nr:DUF2207 domain-containing protein [Candidatus Uhrbacteria bacterium]MBD3283987.1 DUF2207 domain-containing protein [Candidatus Uhrbacteria bacterium]
MSLMLPCLRMRLHQVLTLLFLSLLILLPGSASAQSSDEAVRMFNVTARLQSDRTLTVTETITYDFGPNAVDRHGIFREIPTRYSRNGGTYRLRLELQAVQMDESDVPYRVESRSPNFRIRIGDPDVTISGTHTYTITYTTDRAINFFDGEAELYWNVTGNEWPVPILKSSFSFVGPSAYEANTSPIICYTGAFGSTEQACQVLTQANTAQVISERSYAPYEGLTVALRFPEGLIEQPTFGEILTQIIVDNWILGLPIILFPIMFYLWWHRGREPKGRGTIVPQYEPPRGMSPMEMHALKNQYVKHQAVTATLIDLARRGYFKIEFGEEKKILGFTSQSFTFVKQREADEALQPHEKKLYTGIFEHGDSVELAALKGSFYTSVKTAQERAFRQLKKRNLFGANPNAVRVAYLVGAVVIAGLAIWLLPVIGFTTMGVIAIVASAIMIAVFGWFMPKKTKEGSIALEEIEGFKWFLSVTERDRLKFHNAPSVRPETFHEFLPYAIAFGVEREWAEQFKGLNIPEPSYATGYTTWNALAFTNAMHTLDTSAASTAYSAPSSAGSGGSGFSGGGGGGGFGGGGGGSW